MASQAYLRELNKYDVNRWYSDVSVCTPILVRSIYMTPEQYDAILCNERSDEQDVLYYDFHSKCSRVCKVKVFVFSIWVDLILGIEAVRQLCCTKYFRKRII